MPIRGLTSHIEYGEELPRMGKIRKGAPKEDNRPGGDLDYFRITLSAEYASHQEAVTVLYGEEPTELRNARLLGQTTEFAFQTWMEERSSTKLLHRCDGSSQVAPVAAPCEKETGSTCNCTERGVLKVVLPDLIAMTGIWGYLALETGSIYDIVSLHRSLKFVENLMGSLNGVPFVIKRANRTVTIPHPKKAGERMRVDKSLLFVYPEPEFSRNKLLFAFTREISAIPASVDVSTGEILSTPLISAGQVDAVQTTVHLDSVDVDMDREMDMDFDTLPPATMDINPLRTWDYDDVIRLTSGQFDNPDHQQATIHKLMNDKVIHFDHTTEEVIEIVRQNRAQRSAEKADDGTWVKDQKEVKKFFATVNRSYNLTPSEVMEAINMILPKPIERISQAKGLTIPQAYAACALRRYNYNLDDTVKAHSGSETAIIHIQTVHSLIQRYKDKGL